MEPASSAVSRHHKCTTNRKEPFMSYHSAPRCHGVWQRCDVEIIIINNNVGEFRIGTAGCLMAVYLVAYSKCHCVVRGLSHNVNHNLHIFSHHSPDFLATPPCQTPPSNVDAYKCRIPDSTLAAGWRFSPDQSRDYSLGPPHNHSRSKVPL